MTVKNVLFTVVVFLFSLCVALVILTMINVMSIYTLTMQAGIQLASLSFSVVLSSFFTIIPYAAIVALILVLFFFIRHPVHILGNSIVWIILTVCVWLFIIPFSFEMSESFFPISQDVPTESVPSARYFRPYDVALYYWEKSETQAAFAVTRIDFASGSGMPLISFVPEEKVDSPGSIFSVNVGDVLIRQRLVPPAFLTTIFNRTSHLVLLMAQGYQAGFASYAILASIGIAFASLWICACLSQWRLLNVLFIICGMTFVVYVNAYIYMPSFMESVGGVVTKVITPDFLPLVINAVFSILLNVVGLCVLFLRSMKKKRGQ